MKKMQEIIKDSCEIISNLKQALEGSLLLMKHDGILKRAKIVEKPEEDDEDEDQDFSVFLVDYGDVIEAKMKDFYVCHEGFAGDRKEALQHVFEMPPQCFQCCLSEIIPSAMKCPTGWSTKSKEEFEKFVNNRKVDVVVNSFVDRVASVQLSLHDQGNPMTLEEHLIIEGFAQRSDDSYIRLLDQLHRDTETRQHLNEHKSLENELIDVNFPEPNDEMLEVGVTLDGPHSPLESKPESFCRREQGSRLLQTLVEPSSVNHVLIDPFPNDATKKILIAASMSNKNDRVILHQTTIMPHTPGMACLLGLIFSPIVQVRATMGKRRYTSILTGLGCDLQNRKPHFGEHDCMFFVDVEFDQKDFNDINELRHQMSVVLQKNEEGYKKFSVKGQKENARKKISQLLKEIFERERKPLGLNMENSEWNWKMKKDNEFGEEPSYPPIHVESLVPMSELTRRDLKHHAAELKRKAEINARDEIIKCQLCEETLETLMDLKLHVMKTLHKERLLLIRDETSSNQL